MRYPVSEKRERIQNSKRRVKRTRGGTIGSGTYHTNNPFINELIFILEPKVRNFLQYLSPIMILVNIIDMYNMHKADIGGPPFIPFQTRLELCKFV